MSEGQTEEERQRMIELRKKRQFRKFTFRGKTVEEIMKMDNEEVLDLVKARTRRRMQRGLRRRSQTFLRKLRRAKEGDFQSSRFLFTLHFHTNLVFFRVPRRREAEAHQDSSSKYAYNSRNDWVPIRCLQWKAVCFGRSKTGNAWSLYWRI